MGTLQGTTVKIHIQQDARPRFFRARPVPYALKDKVTAELETTTKGGRYRASSVFRLGRTDRSRA